MKVGPIKGPSFDGIKINAKENTHCEFLYNKILDVIKEEKVPATIRPYDVFISSEKQSIKDKLTQFAIRFISGMKE